ncbi:hypothetical protein [Cellulomonas wangsupingiae]|uniref:hypothetical protein n=1 Tax=Cellulomonas wangsupingiae TaxID=2968085 RepID=UPI001D0F38B7|nr:hypothetical protein [Cellulomonas wangsupingiae]MCM0640924.1 hypothetical protein [Cellulomonas wangsupingiae]
MRTSASAPSTTSATLAAGSRSGSWPRYPSPAGRSSVPLSGSSTPASRAAAWTCRRVLADETEAVAGVDVEVDAAEDDTAVE